MTGSSSHFLTPLYLDANAIIYLLDGRLTFDTRKIIALAIEQERLFLSVVAIAEVRTGLASKVAEDALAELLETSVVEDFTLSMVEAVAALRNASRLLLPDAIIAATALARGGQLMTADKGFAKVLELDVLTPELQ